MGLFTLDIFIPLTLVDRFLGGINLWNLVEALVSVIAIWFFYRAVQVIQGQQTTTIATLVLLIVLLLIAVIFFLIPDRGTTQVQFVANHLQYPQTWLYLLIFLASFATISGLSAWTIRNRWRGLFGLFIVGYVLLDLACVSDIIYITAAHFKLTTTEFAYTFYNSFNLFFYIGIFCLAIGFFTFYTGAVIHRATPRWRMRVLRLTVIRLRMEGQNRVLWQAVRGARANQPIIRTYDELVRIRDLEFMEHVQITDHESLALTRAETALQEQGGLRSLTHITQ